MKRKYLLAAAAALAAITTASTASATIYTFTNSNGYVLTFNTVAGTGTLVGNGLGPNFGSGSINLAFTGNFSGMTSATIPSVPLTSVTGTRVINGVTYRPATAPGGMAPLINGSYLWTSYVSPTGAWLTSAGYFTDFDWIGSWTTTSCVPSPANNQCGTGPNSSTSGGTTTGGTTTGGTTTGGTTTGGTTTGGTTTGGTTTGGTTTGGTTTTGGQTTSGGTTSGGTAVPEPANELALFGLGLAAIVIGRRDILRRKAKA